MKLSSRSLLVAALATAAPLLVLGPAVAAPPAPAPLTSYSQEVGDQVSVPPSTQVRATVSCPRGTKVIGGGALALGTSSTEGLNTSNPNFDERTWVVRINNSDENASAQFRVYAVCAAGIRQYELIEGIGVDNPGGTQATAVAQCPTGKVALGGGGNLTSGQLTSYLNSSRPDRTSWRVTAANANPADDNFVMPYVICGKRPAGWTQVTGTPTTLRPNGQGQAAVACPLGTKVLGGGGQSSSTSQSVTLNSSSPTSPRVWQVYENNIANVPSKLIAYAICAEVA